MYRFVKSENISHLNCKTRMWLIIYRVKNGTQMTRIEQIKTNLI